MEDAHPAPSEELNTGPETVPRPAATVILLRGGEHRLQVLLAQRTPAAKFMGRAWVFPGGAVNEDDGEGEAGRRSAAVRELREEVGIDIGDPWRLVPFSRWITPSAVKIRYDTWFFLAPLPEGAEPQVDGSEMVDARWFSPTDALAAARDGEILLVFPTIKHLEQLSAFATVDELLKHSRSRSIVPVQPRVIHIGETDPPRIVLPGEPGYDD